MRCLAILICVLYFIPSYGKTIVVGPGLPVSSIKQGIAQAKEKDSLLIKKGVYREGSIVLSKSITLIGENFPILDGEHKYEILLISGNNICIKGLIFRNAGYSAMNDFAAVKLVDCSFITIESNTIQNAYFAIHISNSSNVTVRNNRISGSPLSEQLTGNGIHLWKSRDALIENNYVSGHRDGIYFEFVTSTVIRNNLSEKNIRYGLHFMFSNDDVYQDNTFRNNGAGVAVMYSKKVRMERNHFEENWGPSSYGILLKDITDSYIIQNQFLKNTVGIHMEGSSRIDIQKNLFKQNGWAIKVQASCDDNIFHSNNFSSNSFDVSTNGTLVLNTFINNYWDKYEGYDMNKDGIGDIPYHPVSMYSMIVEANPTTLLLFRSFTISMLDKAEKMIPGFTPENLKDDNPMMKFIKL
ncbi:MAG: nitrous oxide reductase family maturation protein NosD [Chitinophagaceae bacterium]